MRTEYDHKSPRYAAAIRIVAVFSVAIILGRTAQVLSQSNYPSSDNVGVLLLVGLWALPALVAALFARRARSITWPIAFTGLTTAMAVMMLIGKPTMAEGGVWFGYALFFEFIPFAVIASLVSALGTITSAVRRRVGDNA